MPDLAARLEAVRGRISAACKAAGRDPAGVRLLAVSKTFPVEALRQALSCGQHEFGESYVQEALAKVDALAAESPTWHFIGPIQSNKTREIAERFDWVHGIDRLKIAQRLSAQRPASLAPLNVCVQVNISGEASKSGCEPGDAGALCSAVSGLPGLRLRGLMAIPEPMAEGADPRAPYAQLRRLFREIQLQLQNGGADFDTISAGMSDDLEAAIAEGSTIVRVGSALFGDRPSKQET